MTPPGPHWWADYFDRRFIELYSPHLSEEVSREEASAIVELLGLGPGTRVLDLGCGWGRHAIELARLGCSVVALDGSPELLAHGRELAARAGVDVEWVQGDMREARGGGEFDVVLSLFSSLGYSLEDEDDLRVLTAARTALTSEGSLILETMHRDMVAREFAERDWWEDVHGAPVWVEREFDAVAGVSREWLRWTRAGEVGEKYHEIRVRTATEWAHLLDAAGLDPLAWYGDWDLAPFSLRSDRLIAVAHRR